MASANDNALASRVALQKRFFNAAVIVKGETIVFAGSQSFSYVHHLRNKRPVYSQRRTTALNNSTRYCRETVSSLIRLMLYRLKKDWYLAVSDCPWLRVFFFFFLRNRKERFSLIYHALSCQRLVRRYSAALSSPALVFSCPFFVVDRVYIDGRALYSNMSR